MNIPIQMINKYHTFVLCIPRGLYLYLEGAKAVPDAVENLRKGIALGGLDTLNFVSGTVDDSKPCCTIYGNQRT